MVVVVVRWALSPFCTSNSSDGKNLLCQLSLNNGDSNSSFSFDILFLHALHDISIWNLQLETVNIIIHLVSFSTQPASAFEAPAYQQRVELPRTEEIVITIVKSLVYSTEKLLMTTNLAVKFSSQTWIVSVHSNT